LQYILTVLEHQAAMLSPTTLDQQQAHN